MFKNLSPAALGVSGRQSELIELALTYGFRGIDLDVDHLAKQAQRRGVDHARRFINSAKKYVSNWEIGSWDLPTRWLGDDAAFGQDVGSLKETAEFAAELGSTRCRTVVKAANDDRPYKENFELHVQRLGKVAEILAPHGIRIGLDFQPAPPHRVEKKHEFIHDFESLLALIKTIGAPNIGLVLDSWTWKVGGGTMDQLKKLSAEKVVSVRLADIPAKTEMADITDRLRTLPKGDGQTGALGIVKLLMEWGYEGPVTPFPHPSTFSGRTREWIVQQAAQSIEELWVAAGLSQSRSVEPVVPEVAIPEEEIAALEAAVEGVEAE